jgi:hypothetical protein
VIFDGSRPVEDFQPYPGLPGVFWIEYTHPGGEYPKLWEPSVRQRYRLVADRHSVARFPATFTVEEFEKGRQRLLFHASDSRAPDAGELLMSAEDFGMFLNRPNVMVRGIAFQNYLAREKSSTGIDLRVNEISVEDCTSTNCSMGFIITGDDNALRRCTAEDVGGGVYVGGENATVEGCRFFKRRDTFMVPMYAQDDTGIQYYVPARGGQIRGNLCEGFGMGVFIKAHAAPYQVEHNTLVGLGQGLGFGSTSWHEGQTFRYNIVADCEATVEVFADDSEFERKIDHNVYWSASPESLQPIGSNDLVANPEFLWPAWRDYRLASNSPCVNLADDRGPCGAYPVGTDTPMEFPEAREWHVSERGREGAEGSLEDPVLSIQFAIDRARPGDVITVHPGVYPHPVHITRGGTPDKPLVIRAGAKWEAILDSNREASTMIQVENAAHVEIRDLEIRWYGNVAIGIEHSPHVSVGGCRIWNAHWHGAWPTGTAIRAVHSPGFSGRNNVLFQQEHAFWFYHSPRATLKNNTCAGNLYSAAAFLYSCENSVCSNNSFAFQGNDVVVIEEELGGKGKLDTFDCDFNNYGTALREQPAGTVFDRVEPREEEPHFHGWSKALVNYSEYNGDGKRFVSMAEWREFSGRDKHTIVADPLYINSAGRDFRIDSNSPNRVAGGAGTLIGALDAP